MLPYIFIFALGGGSSPQVAFGFVKVQHLLNRQRQLPIHGRKPFGHIFVNRAFAYLKDLSCLTNCGLGLQDIGADIKHPLLDILLHSK